MSSRRSSALGLFLVSVLTVISALRQSSRITHRDVFRFQRAGRAYSNVTPEKPTIASCFVRNGTTGLRELGDAYLLSRGSSHLGTLRALKFSLKRALRRGELRIGVAGGSVSVGGGCYEDPEKMWFNNVQREVSNKLQDIGLNVTVKISLNTTHAVKISWDVLSSIDGDEEVKEDDDRACLYSTRNDGQSRLLTPISIRKPTRTLG